MSREEVLGTARLRAKTAEANEEPDVNGVGLGVIELLDRLREELRPHSNPKDEGEILVTSEMISGHLKRLRTCVGAQSLLSFDEAVAVAEYHGLMAETVDDMERVLYLKGKEGEHFAHWVILTGLRERFNATNTGAFINWLADKIRDAEESATFFTEYFPCHNTTVASALSPA
ncbi:MAG: hypothetical protein ACLFU1_04965 [Alphaproteobacteria bacterium]